MECCATRFFTNSSSISWANCGGLARLKTLGRMNVPRSGKPQDGRYQGRRQGNEIDLRLFEPLATAFCEKLSMPDFSILVIAARTFDSLGFFRRRIAPLAVHGSTSKRHCGWFHKGRPVRTGPRRCNPRSSSWRHPRGNVPDHWKTRSKCRKTASIRCQVTAQ